MWDVYEVIMGAWREAAEDEEPGAWLVDELYVEWPLAVCVFARVFFMQAASHQDAVGQAEVIADGMLPLFEGERRIVVVFPEDLDETAEVPAASLVWH